MKNLLDRFNEPSSWAGIGLIVQGVTGLFSSKGADSTAWATLGGGVCAVFLPEKKF